MRLARFASVIVLALAASVVSAQDTVDNPEFTAWSKFKKGTSTTLKSTATAAGMTTESTITTTLVLLAFYLTRPQIDRNYGGGTCCLRWLLWLSPLWILTLLPTVDHFSCCRYGRGFAVLLLVVSVFSATYAADNPWLHPWIFDYWTAMGWIDYK